MDRLSHDPFSGPASDDLASQRNNRRDSLFLAAGFRVAGFAAVHQVRVRNLSAGGLMAEIAVPLTVGAAVEVEIRNVGWVPGKIVWVVDGRVGVAFDAPIDPKRARKPVGGARMPASSKPATFKR